MCTPAVGNIRKHLVRLPSVGSFPPGQAGVVSVTRGRAGAINYETMMKWRGRGGAAAERALPVGKG